VAIIQDFTFINVYYVTVFAVFFSKENSLLVFAILGINTWQSNLCFTTIVYSGFTKKQFELEAFIR
jgi:hypothetical protein